MHFGHESRAITMLSLNEIIPLAIPYHSSLIPMSMQRHRHSKFGGYNIIPRHFFVWQGIVKNKTIPVYSDFFEKNIHKLIFVCLFWFKATFNNFSVIS